MAQDADAKDGALLDEIIVTANRRAQSTQDVAVAVSAVTAEKITSHGFDSAADLSAIVPNMETSTPFGEFQPIFAIRGVSMSDYSSRGCTR